MNIQSDLDISVISLNTHQCSPWDPKGVWHAQESKQSKLGKVFWVQRHGGKYRDACEKWSNVKLGHGGIFLLVFVSVPLLIIRWEFNLLLPSELLELHFRFQFYSQVWGSRDCGSNWILVGWLLQVLHRATAGSHYLLRVYADSICFTSITVIPHFFSNVYPFIIFNSGFTFTPPAMSSVFCSCSASLWIHCLLAGKAPVLGWQMGQTAKQAVASQPEWYFNKHRDVTEGEASHWNDWQFCFQPESTNRWFLASVQKKKSKKIEAENPISS